MSPTDHEKQALTKLHDGLTHHSLKQYQDGDYSIVHNIGHDMLFAQMGQDGSQHYLKLFNEQAQASALQLQIANVLNLVSSIASGHECQIQQVPADNVPYFGLNLQRDFGKAMAFGKENQPGVFESGVSSRVVQSVDSLNDTLKEYVSKLLEQEEAQCVMDFWSNKFGAP